MEYVASRVVLIMVMVRGGCSESFRKSSDDMDDLGRSMHEDEPDRLILGYELRYVEISCPLVRGLGKQAIALLISSLASL